MRDERGFALPLAMLVVLILSALMRSEEHTSELQSQSNLVCRLLLEKKKQMERLEFTTHNLTPPDQDCPLQITHINAGLSLAALIRLSLSNFCVAGRSQRPHESSRPC